ncbi:unnamed protein product [Bursaphelenchus xylophilus]|uniref:(pine wood nematode) hypothetical protein n=1 Tax=Bursaphelenchus xylophilus TaxID=6326 RepID=A0A1I7RH59_BURXY|nr:unnamed protein product [Bursaphelenchus xylophilus]CAG9115965.1 unnamed protein product [Bursaphelenchus xylophilus]
MRILLLSFLSVSLHYSLGLDKGLRIYTCLQKDVEEPTECNLFFMTENDEHVTITDNGCFVERSSNGQLRNYCPLQCQTSEVVDIIQQQPEQTKDVCILGESMGIVKRRRDWFFWRTLECALVESQFEIRCGEIMTNEPFNVIDPEIEGSGQ